MSNLVAKITQAWRIDEEVNKAMMSFTLVNDDNQMRKYTIVMQVMGAGDLTVADITALFPEENRDSVVCNDEAGRAAADGILRIHSDESSANNGEFHVRQSATDRGARRLAVLIGGPRLRC